MTGTTPPISVPASSIPAQLVTVAKIVAVLIPGFVTLLSLLSAHDVAGAWAWLHATDGAAFVAALVTAATLAGGLYKTVMSHRDKVVLADTSYKGVVK